MTSTNTSSRLNQVTSWLSLVILIVVAVGFGRYVPADRLVMMQMFRDFHVELPGLTLIACSVPTPVIVAIAFFSVAGALIVQFRADSKRSAALFNLILTVALGVLFLLYHIAMSSPLTTLIQGISGSPR